jgi:hypothetical protein
MQHTMTAILGRSRGLANPNIRGKIWRVNRKRFRNLLACWSAPNSVVAQILNLLYGALACLAAEDTGADVPKVVSVSGTAAVVARMEGKEARLEKGQTIGRWVLMAVVQPEQLAVFEDFSRTNGHLLFIDKTGVKADLGKTAEPTWADPQSLYRGHTLEEVYRWRCFTRGT